MTQVVVNSINYLRNKLAPGYRHLPLPLYSIRSIIKKTKKTNGRIYIQCGINVRSVDLDFRMVLTLSL